MTRAGALFLWGIAVFLAVLILRDPVQAAGAQGDPMTRFLGSATEAVGDTLFLKADAYFHGGVIEKDHHDETAEELRREGIVSPAGPHEDAPKDWIAAMNRAVHVSEIRHLTKEERKEMLPFFSMASALDPRNVEAVLTTAYWLESEFGKTAEAEEALQKGLKDNPGSWEVENALGRFYSRRGDAGAAVSHLAAAARLSASAKLENYERVDLYCHLAVSLEQAGKAPEALEAYREAARYFDSRTTPFLRGTIEDKIRQPAE